MVYSISISVRLRVSNYPFLLFLTNFSFALLFLLNFWHSFLVKRNGHVTLLT